MLYHIKIHLLISVASATIVSMPYKHTGKILRITIAQIA